MYYNVLGLKSGKEFCKASCSVNNFPRVLLHQELSNSPEFLVNAKPVMDRKTIVLNWWFFPWVRCLLLHLRYLKLFCFSSQIFVYNFELTNLMPHIQSMKSHFPSPKTVQENSVAGLENRIVNERLVWSEMPGVRISDGWYFAFVPNPWIIYGRTQVYVRADVILPATASTISQSFVVEYLVDTTYQSSESGMCR